MGLGFPIAYIQKFRRNILENLKNIALGPNLSQKALICVMFCWSVIAYRSICLDLLRLGRFSFCAHFGNHQIFSVGPAQSFSGRGPWEIGFVCWGLGPCSLPRLGWARTLLVQREIDFGASNGAEYYYWEYFYKWV